MKRILFFAVLILLFTTVFAQSKSGKYIVFLNTNPNKPDIAEVEVNRIQAAHRANMDSLAKAMQLLAAGPFHGGGGIQILAATSLEEAQAMVASDPAVKAQRFTTEVYPLTMGIGGTCPVLEPYEMVEYQFIRYEPVEEKLAEMPEKKIMKLAKRHLSYMKANFFEHSLICQGSFGTGKGGFFMAFKTEDEDFDKFIKYDPMIRSELFVADTRIIWIAKGSFCESNLQK